MEAKIELITPENAQQMLTKNSRNRNIRTRTVDKYARDMLTGAWKTSHQGIAFYQDGTLADGQHRLAAIVKSDVSIDVMVVRGLLGDESYGIDQHAQRNTADTLSIAGNDWIDRRIVAIIRFMAVEMQGSDLRSISASEIEEYGEKNKNSISFAARIAQKKRGVGSAGVSACIACALINGEMETDLEKFVHVMSTGLAREEHEIVAVKLREYLVTEGNPWTNSSMRRSSARKAQRAIKAFCGRELLNKLYEPSRYIYPAPKANEPKKI